MTTEKWSDGHLPRLTSRGERVVGWLAPVVIIAACWLADVLSYWVTGGQA